MIWTWHSSVRLGRTAGQLCIHRGCPTLTLVCSVSKILCELYNVTWHHRWSYTFLYSKSVMSIILFVKDHNIVFGGNKLCYFINYLTITWKISGVLLEEIRTHFHTFQRIQQFSIITNINPFYGFFSPLQVGDVLTYIKLLQESYRNFCHRKSSNSINKWYLGVQYKCATIVRYYSGFLHLAFCTVVLSITLVHWLLTNVSD